MCITMTSFTSRSNIFSSPLTPLLLYTLLTHVCHICLSDVPSPVLIASSASSALSAISTLLQSVEAIHSAAGSSLPSPTSRTNTHASFAGAQPRLSPGPNFPSSSSSSSSYGSSTSILGDGFLGTAAAIGSSAFGAVQLLDALSGVSGITTIPSVKKKEDAEGGRGILAEGPVDGRLARMALEFAACDPSRQGICCAAKHFCHPQAVCSSDILASNLIDLVKAVPRCKCGFGFYGDGRTKGSGCTNIDECSTGEAGCSHICTDKVPGFECSCRKGYSLLEDGKSCQDTDECANGSSGCSHDCINLEGSFRCGCPDGFELSKVDGKHCEDINECSRVDKGPCDHKCHNTIGGFICSCKPGYRLDDATGVLCIDRNECTDGLAPDGRSACPSSQQCSNLPGSYQCNCKQGYQQTTYPVLAPMLSSQRQDSEVSVSHGAVSHASTAKQEPLTSPAVAPTNSQTPSPLFSLTLRMLQGRKSLAAGSSGMFVNEGGGESRGDNSDGIASLNLGPPDLEGRYVQRRDRKRREETSVGRIRNAAIGGAGSRMAAVLGLAEEQLTGQRSSANETPTSRLYYRQNSSEGLSISAGPEAVSKLSNLQSLPNRLPAEIPAEADYSWLQCEDIDECELDHKLNNKPPCAFPFTNCVNTVGSFTCGCPDGKFFSNLLGECVNAESSQQKKTVEADFTAVPLQGRWTDIVRDAKSQGQKDNSSLCGENTHCVGGVCKPNKKGGEGGLNCVCLRGFRRRSSSWGGESLCVDIDECVEGIRGADPCGGGFIGNDRRCCQNTPGGFICVEAKSHFGLGRGRHCTAPAVAFRKS